MELKEKDSGRKLEGRLCNISLRGLNCDLGDKSENLRRMNHFEKFNKANKKFVLQKLLDFSSIMSVYISALKIGHNLI